MPRKKHSTSTLERKSAIFDVAVKLTQRGYSLNLYWRERSADIIAMKRNKKIQIKVTKLRGYRPIPVPQDLIVNLNNPDSYLIVTIYDDRVNKIIDYYIIPGPMLSKLVGGIPQGKISYIEPNVYEKFRNAWNSL